MKVETFDIPPDMKITIAKVVALQSLATEPGQQIAMTRSMIRFVKLGLVIRYGAWDLVPNDYKVTIADCIDKWQGSMLQYGQGQEFWPNAMLPCADVADDIVVIAGSEGMLDYKQIEYNFTQQTFGGNADQIAEFERKQQMMREQQP